MEGIAHTRAAQPAPGAARASPTVAVQSPPQGVSRLPVGALLQGVVLGRAGGGTLLQTAQGNLTLTGGPAMAVGATVTLGILAAGATVQLAVLSIKARHTGTAESQPRGPAAPAPGQASAAALARVWPGLAEAVAAVRGGAPDAATRALDAMLPRPGPDLAAQMLLFAAALRGGDIRAWLGERLTRALEALGRRDLLERLGAEFSTLARAASPVDAGAWRLMAMPIFANGQMHQARMYLRKDNSGGDDGAETPSGTRFIVEVDLTRLGSLQLDGLVRPRRIDLIMRSREALPPAMRHDITEIFNREVARPGHAGALTFQVDPRLSPVRLDPADAGEPSQVA